MQRGEKYRRKYYNKPSHKNRRFFRKTTYCHAGKTTANVGHAEKQDIMLMNAKTERITSLLKH